MTRSVARITPGIFLLALAGCGGGDGDGDVVPLSYSGNTNAAVISTTNAARLTGNVIGGNDAGAILGPLSVAPSGPVQMPSIGFADVAHGLNRAFREALAHLERGSDGQPLKAGATINQMVPCDMGSVQLTGMIDDFTGTGTLNLDYRACTLSGLTLSGPATARIDAFDIANEVPTDFTVSFPRMLLRGAGLNADVGGSLRTQLDIPNNVETLTLKSVSLNNNTGNMTMDNLVLLAFHANVLFPSSYSENITGRSYDGVHGYVDVTTPTVLIFNTASQLFPDSGQVLLTGAGNRTILVGAQSSTMTQLQLDTNGDGPIDNTAFLKWTELTDPTIGGDLGDVDADTMHNGWETANGLNPNLDDAGDDNDGDLVNNVAEYQAGTDPT
jgi:hypothetical protein